ncbi:MAG: phosphonate ABC transporter, permease protein PhnE [Tenericutes bacterium]|nr:phosphonate ABC transporter, permease protein PhnE [Mycoplasmatota bacterium]
MKTLCSKINNYLKTLAKRNLKHRTTVLNDGSVIVRPFSYSLISSLLALAVIVFFWNMIVTAFFERFKLYNFINNLPNFFGIIKDMIVDVNWSYFSNVLGPMADTIRIAVIGTIVGSIIAIPFAILASQNIMGKSKIPTVIKFFLSIIRTFPILIYALILSYIFGYGPFVGVLATIIFTFGIITKMMYEIIETTDMGAFIAIEAGGATKLQAFRAAVVPQVMGRFLSIVLYNFEINLRASAILGFVNAGGIGRIMNDQMALRRYGDVAVMILALLFVVIIVQNISQYLRGRLS